MVVGASLKEATMKLAVSLFTFLMGFFMVYAALSVLGRALEVKTMLGLISFGGCLAVLLLGVIFLYLSVKMLKHMVSELDLG